MKPLRAFLADWFEEVEPDKGKRDAAVSACLVELRELSRKHSALVCNIACLRYLSLDVEE